MKKPAIPHNETARIAALKKLRILDTPAEKVYDDITQLASYISQMPIALISLIDENRQWAKSAHGIDFCESRRDVSICAHAINRPTEITEIEDLTVDERFKGNPLLANIQPPLRFYGGVPLVNENKLALGTLCVMDHRPNKLSLQQKNALHALAQQVTLLFELREKNNHLIEAEEELRKQNELLKNFAGTVSHDMKMPLSNMIVTIDVLKAQYSRHLDGQGQKYLNYLKQSSFTLSDYISSILTHYETDKIAEENVKEEVDLHQLLEEIVDLFNIQEDCEIHFPEQNTELYCNKVALEQILLNLIGNSLKYNDKDKIEINIDFEQDKDYYYFRISDNGIGIPDDKKDDIFDLFSTATTADRNGRKGNGIGLSTVKKLVNGLGGNISVSSVVGKNTCFKFSLQKQQRKKTA